MLRLVVVPSPSWPKLLLPQHFVVASSSRAQFQPTQEFGRQIRADATSAAAENKKHHRGTVGSFLFGDGNEVRAVTAPYAVLDLKEYVHEDPPYQIAPDRVFKRDPNVSTHNADYQRPGTAAYREAATLGDW